MCPRLMRVAHPCQSPSTPSVFQHALPVRNRLRLPRVHRQPHGPTAGLGRGEPLRPRPTVVCLTDLPGGRPYRSTAKTPRGCRDETAVEHDEVAET